MDEKLLTILLESNTKTEIEQNSKLIKKLLLQKPLTKEGEKLLWEWDNQIDARIKELEPYPLEIPERKQNIINIFYRLRNLP